MELYEGTVAAGDAIRRFYYINEQSLPDIVRERVGPFVGGAASNLDLIVRFVDATYANRADMPKEAMAIAAAAGMLIYEGGYHADGIGKRVLAMVPVLRRDSGEKAPTGAPWPAKRDDPAANAEFMVPEPIVAAAPPPVPPTQE